MKPPRKGVRGALVRRVQRLRRTKPQRDHGAVTRARQRIATLGQPLADALVQLATHPAGAEAAHTVLSTVGNAHLRAAFQREPLAHTLFELAEWAGEEADRGPVVAALMKDALHVDGGFHNLVRFDLERAREGCIGTLGALAALGRGVAAPLNPTEAWLRETLPERFHAAIEPLYRRQKSSVGGRVQSLVRRAPTPFPTGTSFLFGPYLTFLHTYLARNLVDALPRVTEKIREAAESNPSIPGDSAGRMRARSLEDT